MPQKRRLIVQCCVCKRVRSRTGRWYRRRDLSATRERSHTYCPRCAQEARQRLADLRGRPAPAPGENGSPD
jgi:hypothetical protein